MRNKFSVGDNLEILSPYTTGKSFAVESIIDANGNSRDCAHIPREILSVYSPEELHEGDILRIRL